MMKRFTSILLTAVMLIGLIGICPASASAASASSYIAVAKTFSVKYRISSGAVKTVKIKAPKIKLSGNDAKDLNNTILERYKYQISRLEYNYNAGRKFKPYIKYDSYLYGDILSVLVYENNYDLDCETVYVYNINVKTKKKLDNESILKKAGITKKSADEKMLAAVERNLESGKSKGQKYYSEYGNDYYSKVKDCISKYTRYYFNNSGDLKAELYYYWVSDSKYVGYSLRNAAIVNAVKYPKVTTLKNVNGGVRIAWEKISGAKKYRLFYMTDSGWKRFGADGSAVSCTINSLDSGQEYTFTVRALDSKGNYIGSYYKKGYSITYIAAPALPTLENTSSGVKVTWKKVAGAKKYRVLRKTSSGDWKTVADTTRLSCVDTTAKSGVKYTYTIRCISSDGTKYTSGCKSGKSITVKK